MGLILKFVLCNTANTLNVFIGNSTTDMVGTACQSGLVIYLSTPAPLSVSMPNGCSNPFVFSVQSANFRPLQTVRCASKIYSMEII